MSPQNPEKKLVPSLLAAVQGRWQDFDWGTVRQICDNYRDGTDAKPGSENWPVLSYLCALMVLWKRSGDLPRIGQTALSVTAWWDRELETRLRKGLQLLEARSRIYAIWGAPLICWLRPAFRQFSALDAVHLRFVRATTAMVALCSYPVRARTPVPPADTSKAPLRVTCALAGARSWSPDWDGAEDTVPDTHHLLSSGWDYHAHLLLHNTIPRGNSQLNWAHDLVVALRPGWMGLTNREHSLAVGAIREPEAILVEDLMLWLVDVGTRWPCRLVRFKHGAACLGLDRSVNGNTAPLFAAAIHREGEFHYLATHRRARRVDSEPCEVGAIDQGNDLVRYAAIAGGEDHPRRKMVLKPEKWGRVLWDIEIRRNGRHEIHRPREDRPAPPPPPEPPPPEPSPEPPPSEEERRCDSWPGFLRWLCRLVVRLT